MIKVSLKINIETKLSEALKAKDKKTYSTLRLVVAAIKDTMIAKKIKDKKTLPDNDLIGLLKKMVKQRNDSCEAYKKAGRNELLENEMLEIGEIIDIMGIDRWRVEEELPPGIGIVDFLLETGAAKSRKQAKQLIKQGGCYLNNIRVDINKRVTEDDLASESMMVLRIGKKDYRLVRFE